jgi:hypothetical protein
VKKMTNNQAQGYVLLACKDLDISKEEAEKIIYAMESQFDRFSESEAEKIGFDWLYENKN